MTTQHTPTPWASNGNNSSWTVTGADGQTICTVSKNCPNAVNNLRLLLRACNAHERQRDILQDSVEILETVLQERERLPAELGGGEDEVLRDLIRRIKENNAAIAKAGGN